MNNDYRIEVFKYEHFSLLDPLDPDSKELATHKNHEAIMKHYANSSYAFTGFYKDVIIGIAGLIPLWEGTAEAWLFTSHDFAKHKRFVYVEIKRHLENCLNIMKLTRIQAVCVADFEKAQNFARHLGFRKEGDLRKYMYDRDYVIYARIRDDQTP